MLLKRGIASVIWPEESYEKQMRGSTINLIHKWSVTKPSSSEVHNVGYLQTLFSTLCRQLRYRHCLHLSFFGSAVPGSVISPPLSIKAFRHLGCGRPPSSSGRGPRRSHSHVIGEPSIFLAFWSAMAQHSRIVGAHTGSTFPFIISNWVPSIMIRRSWKTNRDPTNIITRKLASTNKIRATPSIIAKHCKIDPVSINTLRFEFGTKTPSILARLFWTLKGIHFGNAIL